MKKNFLRLSVVLSLGLVIGMTSCKEDKEDDDDKVVVVDPGTSESELLVKAFDTPPLLDGDVEGMWATAKKLVGTATVPDAGSRGSADFNGDGSQGPAGVFDPYTGESNDFVLRAGVNGDRIYFLLEWDDLQDSKDRQSWYFDGTSNSWKGQHKYANDNGDKYYEDKFAFLWAANDVAGFDANTCYATCHQGLEVTDPSQKAARHYLNNEGELVDMWHWKRVRCTVDPTVIDDQKMIYKLAGDASVNGRTGDAGTAGYHNNKQSLNNGTDDVNVPMYVIPNQTSYFWITADQIADNTAKLITAVDANGVLTYDGGTIDPSTGGFEDGIGNMRIPSVWVENFTGSKADISSAAIHTGSGWIVEFSRKLNTGNADDDVVFDVSKEYPFGLALFNNAAIAHEIKSNLKMKFE